MGGAPLPAAIKSFTLHFTCDAVCISTNDGKENFDFLAAMDGSRKQNLIPGRLIGQVLANAWWEQEKVLTFEENQVTIKSEDNMLFKLETPTIIAKKK